MKKVKFLSVLSIIALAFIFSVSNYVFAENVPSVALDGVQIRLTETRGIRYIAEVSGKSSDYDEVGMLIIPSSMLSGELTLEMHDNTDNAQAYGFRGQGYDQCNQGTHFAHGTLYLNLGHDGVYIWKCKLYNDGSIAREEFHKYVNDGGAPITSAISGIEKYGKYLIFSNGEYIHVYNHDKLR